MTAPVVIRLGCRLNLAESERIEEMLAGHGHIRVSNSCAVTAEAVRDTRRAVRRARRDHPSARLLVTGCAGETERTDLQAMTEVDGIVPNGAKLDWRAYGIQYPSQPTLPSLRNRTRAFVAIQNGCDHSCTFCIIPQGRGPSRSVPITDVLREIDRHLEGGASEVVLTGVDVTAWGAELAGAPALGDLVEGILKSFPALPRLRLSSLDGAEIDPLLFELLASEPRLMPHLHLSLQHGHDLILKRMKRRHSRRDAVEPVEKLTNARPGIATEAAPSAGFPTEDEKHHRANLSLVRELGIVHGHVFAFSARHDTPAARMPQVRQEAIRARAAELRCEIAAVRNSWMKSLAGTPLRVLAERDGKGYAENYARVATPGAVPGQIVTVVPRIFEDNILQ